MADAPLLFIFALLCRVEKVSGWCWGRAMEIRLASKDTVPKLLLESAIITRRKTWSMKPARICRPPALIFNAVHWR